MSTLENYTPVSFDAHLRLICANSDYESIYLEAVEISLQTHVTDS
jgi:hypothetical protein